MTALHPQYVYQHPLKHLRNYGRYSERKESPPLVTLHDIKPAGLGGLVGCAVRLETRRSRVQPPPRSATFFCGD